MREKRHAPLDELHGEKPVAGVLEQLTEADEVAVPHVLQLAKLVLEAQHRVGAPRLQRLQRDHRVALAIERLVDHAHPTGADPAPHLEAGGALEFALVHEARSVLKLAAGAGRSPCRFILENDSLWRIILLS